MPDIQTALKSALSRTLQEWDDDGEQVPQASSTISTTINNSVSAPSQGIPMKKTFNITNNVSRETFNYIKNNPGSTRKEIVKALDHMGFKEASTSSIMSQLCRDKQAHITNGLYYVDIPEYRPIKNPKTAARQAKAVAVETKKKRPYTKVKRDTAGIGALLGAKLEAMPTPSQDALDAAEYAMGGVRKHARDVATIIRNKTPEDTIKNLTVYQARDLYLHLKQIFGG